MKGLESPHAPLSHPGRLMGKFCPVIGVLGGVVGYIRDELPVGNPVTPQLVCDDSSRFIAACSQQALEEVAVSTGRRNT